MPRHASSARALTTKMNNDRADCHYYSFVGFHDIGRSVTPSFLFENRFYLQLSTMSTHCPKMNKKAMWEGKINSRFLSTGHQILPSCGCKVHETGVDKCELGL